MGISCFRYLSILRVFVISIFRVFLLAKLLSLKKNEIIRFMRAQISQWAPWLDGHWTGALAALGAYLAALDVLRMLYFSF